jgi:hypothetical protein
MPITRPSSIDEMLSETVIHSALRRNGQLSMIGLRVMFKGVPREEPMGSPNPTPPRFGEGKFRLHPLSPSKRELASEANRVGADAASARVTGLSAAATPPP